MLYRPLSDARIFRYALCALAAMLVVALVSLQPPVWAQPPGPDDGGPSAAPLDLGEQPLPADPQAGDPAPADGPSTVLTKQEGINVLTLSLKGGWFMLPIAVMSLLVVTFVIERFIALRPDRVLPDELVSGLGQLGGPQSGFDPRKAYRLCQQFPSAAAVVIRAMLLKVGRPHSEVEHAVSEASEREAERLYGNVRWLNLAAAVSPLMGLMGTVWGMIRAFHDTTQLAPGQNKADYLAEGIYVALVTTLAGLAVAIPAAIFSHYFEGRIQTRFHQINELLFNLMPQVERYEGRVRFSRQMGEAPDPKASAPRKPADAEPKSPVPK